MKKRCPWVNLNNLEYIKYHDQEWGVPVHEDNKHFEMLILEGAQAGLSWEMILNKRENYRHHFESFSVSKVAKFPQERIEKILLDPGVIRNRLKIESVVSNARAFLKIQQEFGSFDIYIWQFMDGRPLQNHFSSIKDYPTQTPISEKISKDLKKRGFKFIGATIIYSYMQAIGLVNDHVSDCFLSNCSN